MKKAVALLAVGAVSIALVIGVGVTSKEGNQAENQVENTQGKEENKEDNNLSFDSIDVTKKDDNNSKINSAASFLS